MYSQLTNGAGPELSSIKVTVTGAQPSETSGINKALGWFRVSDKVKLAEHPPAVSSVRVVSKIISPFIP